MGSEIPRGTKPAQSFAESISPVNLIDQWLRIIKYMLVASAVRKLCLFLS